MYIANGTLEVSGELDFQNCSCLGSGGGLLMKEGHIQQRGGNMSLDTCTALQNGGGVSLPGSFSQAFGRDRN